MTPQEKREYHKEYREKNKEKTLLTQRRYYNKKKNDPEFKARRKNSQIKFRSKPEVKERNRNLAKERWLKIKNDPELKEKRRIDRIKKYNEQKNDPKFKEKIRQIIANRTPEQKQRYAKRSSIVNKKRRLEEKMTVYNHYSNGVIQCVCCGEKELDFLSLDHINNDGAEHRRKIGRQNTIKWILANNYPPIFQLLCMNCNFSKGKNGNNGKCQHEIKRVAAA